MAAWEIPARGRSPAEHGCIGSLGDPSSREIPCRARVHWQPGRSQLAGDPSSRQAFSPCCHEQPMQHGHWNAALPTWLGLSWSSVHLTPARSSSCGQAGQQQPRHHKCIVHISFTLALDSRHLRRSTETCLTSLCAYRSRLGQAPLEQRASNLSQNPAAVDRRASNGHASTSAPARVPAELLSATGHSQPSHSDALAAGVYQSLKHCTVCQKQAM